MFKALIITLLLAFAIASVATFRDWYRNPSQLFHDHTGTHWSILIDTFVSWFWPLALLAILVTLAISVLKRIANKKDSI